MRSMPRQQRVSHNASFPEARPEFPDKATTPLNAPLQRRNRRGRGRQPHPASHTLDLGKFDREDDLDSHAQPSQLRSGPILSFFRNIFAKSDDIRTRPQQSHIPKPSRYSTSTANVACSGRLGRQAAASSLGSLQSYATSTIRAGSGPMPSCLGQGSTSEVVMKRRVLPRRELDDHPVFSNLSDSDIPFAGRPDRLAYPTFSLAEYGGPDNWASDVFVLPHNAIRWEIMDMYTILSSIQRRWNFLTMLDVREASEFWQVFEVFVAQYFEIEDQIVFPYMLNVAAESVDLKRYHKVVKYNRDRLEHMLYNIGVSLEQFNSLDSGHVLANVFSQMVDFLPKLLDYMQQQEHVLPHVFSSYCDPQDRIMINRASANFIVRAANGRDGIAILTRWIEDSLVLQAWKNENLSARAQHSHRKWIANLEATHVDVARRFQRRMRILPKTDIGPSSGRGVSAHSGLVDRSDSLGAGNTTGVRCTGRRSH